MQGIMKWPHESNDQVRGQIRIASSFPQTFNSIARLKFGANPKVAYTTLHGVCHGRRERPAGCGERPVSGAAGPTCLPFLPLIKWLAILEKRETIESSLNAWASR